MYNKKLLMVSVLFLNTLTLFPQIDTTRKEFYPLQIGNLWQYVNQDNHVNTANINRDTIIDNKIYFIFENSGGLRTVGIGARVDSLMRVQIRMGAPVWGDSCGGCTPYEMSIYHLSEPDSTSWEVCDLFSGIPTFNQLVRFNNISIQYVFGEQREVLQFSFGGVPFNEDTIWTYGASLARGIGIINENYYDGSYSYLRGAIIDGKQYGNIVSNEEVPNTKPCAAVLYQNYPNPFNPITTITYQLSEESMVILKICDVLGREVKILEHDIKRSGIYKIEFNASELSSGLYIAVLQINEAYISKKMLLIK